MMKTEGKYILGTADEITEYILRDVLKEKFIDIIYSRTDIIKS